MPTSSEHSTTCRSDRPFAAYGAVLAQVRASNRGASMRKITEVQLPGVGVRYEFTSARGERIAVVAHRGGRQDLSLYDQNDADTCRTIVELDSEDAATLATVL